MKAKALLLLFVMVASVCVLSLTPLPTYAQATPTIEKHSGSGSPSAAATCWSTATQVYAGDTIMIGVATITSQSGISISGNSGTATVSSFSSSGEELDAGHGAEIFWARVTDSGTAKFSASVSGTVSETWIECYDLYETTVTVRNGAYLNDGQYTGTSTSYTAAQANAWTPTSLDFTYDFGILAMCGGLSSLTGTGGDTLGSASADAGSLYTSSSVCKTGYDVEYIDGDVYYTGSSSTTMGIAVTSAQAPNSNSLMYWAVAAVELEPQVLVPYNLPVANSATTGTFSLTSVTCYPTSAWGTPVTTVAGDGSTHNVYMDPSCTWLITVPSSGTNYKYLLDNSGTGATTQTAGACAASGVTCSTVTPAVSGYYYELLQNTWQLSPQSGQSWNTGGTDTVTGEIAGTGGQTGCSISISSGSGSYSCSSYFDYGTVVTITAPFTLGSITWNYYADSPGSGCTASTNTFTCTSTAGSTNTVTMTSGVTVAFTFTISPSGAAKKLITISGANFGTGALNTSFYACVSACTATYYGVTGSQVVTLSVPGTCNGSSDHCAYEFAMTSCGTTVTTPYASCTFTTAANGGSTTINCGSSCYLFLQDSFTGKYTQAGPSWASGWTAPSITGEYLGNAGTTLPCSPLGTSGSYNCNVDDNYTVTYPGTLTGSGSTLQWTTTSTTCTPRRGGTCNPSYYQQYYPTFTIDIAGQVSAFQAGLTLGITGPQYGSGTTVCTITTTAASSATCSGWVDNGGSAVFAQYLTINGKCSNCQWQNSIGSSTTCVVNSASSCSSGVLSASYYYQLTGITFTFTPVNYNAGPGTGGQWDVSGLTFAITGSTLGQPTSCTSGATVANTYTPVSCTGTVDYNTMTYTTGALEPSNEEGWSSPTVLYATSGGVSLNLYMYLELYVSLHDVPVSPSIWGSGLTITYIVSHEGGPVAAKYNPISGGGSATLSFWMDWDTFVNCENSTGGTGTWIANRTATPIATAYGYLATCGYSLVSSSSATSTTTLLVSTPAPVDYSFLYLIPFVMIAIVTGVVANKKGIKLRL